MNRRRLLGGLAVPVLALAATGSAHAAVTTCQGLGLTPNNMQAGVCGTDANGGSGNVIFSNEFQTVTLSAKTHKSAEEVASSWQSNGPVTITTHAVCVAVDVSQLSLKGGATVTEQLAISYNGAEYAEPATPVDTAALHEYCGAVPDGATNVFWQLLTTSGGDKPTSQALVTQTLSSVTL